MKNTKLALKFLLILGLFASNVLAEGQMNTGGLNDDGQMNTGGKTCNPQTQICAVCDPQTQNCGNAVESDDDGENSVFTFIKEYLDFLLG